MRFTAQVRTTPLHEGWQFRQTDSGPGYGQPSAPGPKWRPAVVPGHVHDDLLRNGLIADPFAAQHEAGCQWVDLADWEYALVFDWQPHEGCPKRVLRFEGLDTVATIHLNGEVLGEGNNMFVPVEFDVTERLRPGPNRLQVSFASAVRAGTERRRAWFETEGLPWDTASFEERAFVRKVQCMFGWDWGPRLVSCGIWRPVRLLEFASRVLDFEVRQERLSDGRFRVWSDTTLDTNIVYYTVLDGHPEVEGDFDHIVENPVLWWPNALGSPHLYTAHMRAGDERRTRRVGLRTVRLVREPDVHGESFAFEVNDTPFWAYGANWIPEDAFPSRIDEAQTHRSVEACANLGMNMLRVWGGGLYESEAFYDACDERGILVWQDFPFACCYYPDDPAFQAVVAAEAAHHVRRLRSRASLALWCGNNENETMWEGKWGGTEKSPPRYCGAALYAHTLAEVVGTLDPDTPYIRTSPTGRAPEGTPTDEPIGVNMGGWGDQHYWDVWHGRGDWVHYRESKARFCSEFGFAASCSLAQWARVLPARELAGPESDVVRWHDKTNKPWDVFSGLVELHYPPSTTLEDWVYASQLNQRDALRCGIEHYRLSEPCRGALIWQFNDCWPVQSWAVRDALGLLKPAGFELARLYAPVIVCLSCEGGLARAQVAHNVSARLIVAAFDARGVEVRRSAPPRTPHGEGSEPPRTPHGERSEPPRTSGGEGAGGEGSDQPGPYAELDLSGLDPHTTFVSAWVDGLPATRTWRTGADPKDMLLQPPSYQANWADGTLTLRVEGLAYDLVVRDADDAFNVRGTQGLPGLQAFCVASGELLFECCTPPERLALRSLAGADEISL